MINMADRSDKLDAMTLIASLTGFSFSIVNGVLGTEVAPKALATAWVRELLTFCSPEYLC